MRVLFVCKANVGRSQMAEAIFNKLAEGKAVSFSAGTDPGAYEGHKLKEVGPKVTMCMKDLGIDVSESVSKHVTRSEVDRADLVVSMVEMDKCPEYIQKSGKLVLWNIDDPRKMDYDDHVMIRNQIYRKVERLLQRLRI